MREDITIRTMRYMAWARAKGELDSILETYWNDTKSYNAMKEKIKEFVTEVEKQGIQE